MYIDLFLNWDVFKEVHFKIYILKAKERENYFKANANHRQVCLRIRNKMFALMSLSVPLEGLSLVLPLLPQDNEV